MLRAVPMVHMQIQVPNREAAAVTRQIASYGFLHLVDIAHGKVVTADAAPTGTRELLAAFRDLARRIRRIAERLDVALPDPAGPLAEKDIRAFDEERRELERQIAPLESSVEQAWRRRNEGREQAARARESLARAERLRRTAVDPLRLSRLRLTTVVVGLSQPDDLVTLTTALSPSPHAIVPLDQSGGDVLAAIAVPEALGDRLAGVLRVVSFEPVPATSAAMDPESARQTFAAGDNMETQAAADLDAMRASAAPVLADLAGRADLGVLLLQAQTHFAAAGRYTVISGWIPADRAETMTHAIAAVTQSRAVVDIETPEEMTAAPAEALRIPILYRNPLLLRPFQSLVRLYGLPSYREIQPTAFFAISFLLMFGFMFGDLGQGLVLFSAGLCLFRYVPRFLDYGLLLMECGAAASLFGVLYGSFFGIEGIIPVIWMEPLRDLPRFMALAIGFGVLLVSLGLIFNVVNSWRAGERVPALIGPRGLAGAFIYWVLIALLARAFVPAQVVLPASALLLMLVVPIVLLVFKRPIVRFIDRGAATRVEHPPASRWLVALEGSVELVDTLFSYFANTVSFVRLAAFAAVHAGVLVAMFALADTLARFRFGQPLGIASLVAGNIVMIFLEGLTVSVQVLRLEYYEFFGKFFRGGGEPYRPLMLRKGGT